MPDRFQLNYLPAAQEYLLQILDFIALDSADRALSFNKKIDRRVWVLEQQPRLGRIPRNQKQRNLGYRVLILESYLVFYVIRKHTIDVHRIVHGSRNLNHLL